MIVRWSENTIVAEHLQTYWHLAVTEVQEGVVLEDEEHHGEEDEEGGGVEEGPLGIVEGEEPDAAGPEEEDEGQPGWEGNAPHLSGPSRQEKENWNEERGGQ